MRVREEVGLDRLNKRYAHSKPNFMNLVVLVGRLVGGLFSCLSVGRL